MKKLLLSLCLCTLANILMAQVEKNVIIKCVKGEITYTEPVAKEETKGEKATKVIGTILSAAAGVVNTTTDHPEYADNVKASIINGIGNARRIQMVDGQLSLDELDPEEPVMYVEANISAIKCSTRVRVWTDDKKKTHEDTEYKAVITASITLKSARTDAIVKSINVNTSDWGDYWFSTPDKSIGYAVEKMKNNITQDLNWAYPLYASIVEGASAKKDKQKEVYIDLGAPAGVYKGLQFYVYVVTIVAGKEAKKEIGRLKVTEVMGDEISLCKVMKGGAYIKQAIDEGKILQITSRD